VVDDLEKVNVVVLFFQALRVDTSAATKAIARRRLNRSLDLARVALF